MAKFLSGRKSNLNLGITSVTESSTVLQTSGKVGIGTSATENYGLHVAGIDNGVVRDNSLYVSGNSRVTGNVHVDDTLYVAGITTVDGGPLLVGGASTSGTVGQVLQVEGGAYISTSVGIGYTNPFADLTIYNQSGSWISLVDPGQSSSAFENNAGNLYIRSEAGSGADGQIIFQTGTADYLLRPTESGSNRMRIDTDGDVLINSDNSTGTLGQKLQVFGSSYIQNQLGIGRTNPFYKLEVIGDTVITGFTSIGKQTDISGNLYVAGISTLNGPLTLGDDVTVAGDLDVDGHTELDNVNVSGTLTAYNLDVSNDFDIYAPDSVFYGNVTIQGDVSIGGTSVIVNAEQLRVEDKDLILGFTTTVTPNDNTANHAGLAVASTEGHYLVPLQVVGINSLPDTYKQIMWVKHNTMGAGTTDAWLYNQAVGIGSTLVPNNIRLAVGDVKIGDFSIDARNITGTAATITSGNFTILDGKTSYIDVGFATHLSGTSLNYVGISTINNVRAETLTLSGVSTFSGNVDIDADVDIDGHTELDNVNISGIVTAYELDVEGHTELDNINVSGVSTFAGIGTFQSDLYVGGDLYIADDLVFDEFLARNAVLTGNLQVAGVSTFNGNVDLNADIDVDGHTELDALRVSGVATFQSNVYLGDNDKINLGDNDDLQFYHDGSDSWIWEQGPGNLYIRSNGGSINLRLNSTDMVVVNENSSVDLYYGSSNKFQTTEHGIDVTGTTDTDQLNVSGVSTFTGIGTFQNDLYVGGDLYVADDLVFDEFTARNATLTGNINGDTLIISGLSTFTTGPVLVGTGTSTGTSAQAFQVDSGAYFAGPVGVASTNPNYDLDVNGDINFNGDLYKDGILFVAGVGIGSTEVNPSSGVITSEARVGTGFTDINFVGTGLSITGYGSTVVIDLDSVGGARVSVSTEPPAGSRAGDLWWESDTGDLKVYYADGDSSQWVDTNGGENLAVIGEFPPASPLAGDLWWDSVYGQLKIYYDDGDSQQWVDTSNANNVLYWYISDSATGIHTSYNVGINTEEPTEALEVYGYISIDGRVSAGTTTAETTTTSQIGIHSAVPVTSYRSIDYTIQATEGSSYHTTKITALHDGSTAYHTEYGTIYNSAEVATYDVDVSGGNIRLLATPASSGITTFNIVFDAIKV